MLFSLNLPFQTCQYQYKPLKQVDLVCLLNDLYKNNEHCQTKSQRNLKGNTKKNVCFLFLK